MTKSKSGMVTRDDLYPVIDVFPDEVGKKKYLLLHLDGYLFSMAHDNEYLPRGSKENALSITVAGNVSVSR